MKNKMDALDWELIKLLKRDARTSNVSLARELGVSEGMVRQRIARLRESGMIRSFTIETAPKGLKALLEIEVEVNVHTSSVATKIMELEGVQKVYELSGAVDIIALIDVESVERLNDTIEDIRKVGHIRSTRTKLVLNEL
ncbi:MAG: Lrp/AsnC family transcriptional regulator [Thermoplasmatota archaeon]